MNYEIEYHEYDVVVVGAGGSGLRATVGAVENGFKTACISLINYERICTRNTLPHTSTRYLPKTTK